MFIAQWLYLFGLLEIECRYLIFLLYLIAAIYLEFDVSNSTSNTENQSNQKNQKNQSLRFVNIQLLNVISSAAHKSI